MRTLLLSILPLLASILFSVTGSGALVTLLGVRVEQLGYPAFVAGAMGAAYFGGQLLGALYLHRHIQAVGHVRAFAAFSALLAIATLLHGLVIDPWVWIGLRLLGGACVAGLFMGAESWLNARAENSMRGQVLSLYMIIIYSGIGLGQYLITLYPIASFELLGVIAGLVVLALVPVSLTTGPVPPLPAPGAVSLPALWREAPTALIGCAGAGLILGTFYSVAPLFAQAMGMDTAGVAQAMSLGIFGGLLAQWPVGRLSDKLDRRLVLAGLFGLALVSSLTLAWLGMTLGTAGILGLFALFGVAAFVLYPVAVSHAFDRVPAERMVQASAGMMIVYSLGASIGPLGASGLMTLIGPAGLYYFTATMAAICLLLVVIRLGQRSPPPPQNRSPFAPSSSTSRSLVDLDPRVPGAKN